jgi:predicted DNA-binding transcriptional regulator YafY
MPANLLANIRYNIIDQCIRDTSRTWHAKEIEAAVADGLLEHGITKAPSKRTVMGDIAVMKSGILGYSAPIIHSKEQGYHYANPKFSIHHIHLPSQLIEDLKQGIALVNQLTRNEKLHRLSASLTKMKEYLHIDTNEKHRPIIYFEHSLNEPGQKWLDIVYEYIIAKTTLRIQYSPFEGPNIAHVMAPAFIKEYNNRWYVFGYHFDMKKIVNLALDRITTIQPSIRPYEIPTGFDHDVYFSHLFGVTIPEDTTPIKIRFSTTHLLSKYMITKPIHPTQTQVESDHLDIFEIEVYDNYEIRSKLRSFGDDLTILSPPTLVNHL